MRRKNERTPDPSRISGLLELCREGHKESWEKVIRTFSPLVWTVARSHRLSDSDCEDVYQLTWQRLLENLDKITQPERLGTWLVTVARREALLHVNRARLLVCAEDPRQWDRRPGPVEATPENQVVDRTGHELVLAEIRKLPEQRQALIGNAVHGSPISLRDHLPRPRPPPRFDRPHAKAHPETHPRRRPRPPCPGSPPLALPLDTPQDLPLPGELWNRVHACGPAPWCGSRGTSSKSTPRHWLNSHSGSRQGPGAVCPLPAASCALLQKPSRGESWTRNKRMSSTRTFSARW